MKGLRDFTIFVLLIVIGCYLWSIKKTPLPAPKPKTEEKVQVQAKPQIQDTQYILTYQYKVRLNREGLSRAVLTIPVPYSDTQRQTVSSIDYSHKVSNLTTKDDSKYAQIAFFNPTEDTIDVTMKVKALLHRYDYQTAARKNRNYDKLDSKFRYLGSENNIEVNSAEVKSVADKISAQNKTEILQKISEYLHSNIEIANIQTRGAARTIKSRRASTTDFANTFVALARAKGIPARVVSGCIVKNNVATRHAWAEIYFKEYGWVTFDPMRSKDDIFTQSALYIVSAVNSFQADSIETTYGTGNQRYGTVDMYVKAEMLN